MINDTDQPQRAPQLTPEQFDAIPKGGGRAMQGARRVLVDGETVRGAARELGISNTAVQQAMGRILKRFLRQQEEPA